MSNYIRYVCSFAPKIEGNIFPNQSQLVFLPVVSAIYPTIHVYRDYRDPFGPPQRPSYPHLYMAHRENIDNDRSIVGLLYKTAHNRYLDQCRKDQRQQVLKQEFYIEKMSELMDEGKSKKNKKIKLLRKEMALLPPKCREIFELAKLDGLKYKEIAVQLKVSVKTVENQMGIALTKLREALKESRAVESKHKSRG